jgi:hypothetical protein
MWKAAIILASAVAIPFFLLIDQPQNQVVYQSLHGVGEWKICNPHITSCNGADKWAEKGPFYRGSSRMIRFVTEDKSRAGAALALTVNAANAEGGVIVFDEPGEYNFNVEPIHMRSAVLNIDTYDVMVSNLRLVFHGHDREIITLGMK